MGQALHSTDEQMDDQCRRWVRRRQMFESDIQEDKVESTASSNDRHWNHPWQRRHIHKMQIPQREANWHLDSTWLLACWQESLSKDQRKTQTTLRRRQFRTWLCVPVEAHPSPVEQLLARTILWSTTQGEGVHLTTSKEEDDSIKAQTRTSCIFLFICTQRYPSQ
jgi:hypothetical protein